MVKQFVILLLLILNASALFAQNARSYIRQGNELYRQKKYQEAEAAYRKATAKKDQTVESNFNLGASLYRQKKFDSAGMNFASIASSSTNPLIKAGAYHNLGNSLMAKKQYDKSIDVYKKALLNNPNDDETRYNLAYAQEMLKKQQNNNNKNKNNQNKNNQDKNKNNQNNDKNKNNPKSDKNKNDQDKNKPDQDKNKDGSNQNNPGGGGQQGQPPPADNVSNDDAQRMLDALNDQEKDTQDKLKNKRLKGVKVPVIKDW